MQTYDNSDELYHYGVLGMKWGVRRYQRKDGSLTSAGKNRYLEGSNSKVSASKKNKKPPEDSDETKQKGLTDKQKKALIIGAAAVGTGVAIYGGYKLHRLYTGADSPVDPETGFRLINKNMSDFDNLNQVNPGRIRFLSKTYKNKEIIDGSSYNCMLCTTAYDLRKRGFDVHAGLSKDGYMPDDLFSKIYKGYKGTTKIPSVDVNGDSIPEYVKLAKIEKQIRDYGSGSRGNIVCWWKGNGGHSMIWENIDGKVIFKDGQTGKVYENFASEILSNTSSFKPVELLRTDNMELNLSEMKKVINTDTVFKTYVKHGAEITKNMADDPVVQATAAAAMYGGAIAYTKHQERSMNNVRKKQS